MGYYEKSDISMAYFHPKQSFNPFISIYSQLLVTFKSNLTAVLTQLAANAVSVNNYFLRGLQIVKALLHK